MMKWWRRAIAKNLHHPQDTYFGWYAMRHMIKKNTILEQNAVELCDIQPNHKVLEVGFGPGLGLKAALEKVKNGSGKIYGIDISYSVVEKAWKKYQNHIASGQLDLLQGSVMLLPYSNSQFDRIFHCNCHYFWKDQVKAGRELFRVMKPHSFMVTTINVASIKKLKEKGMLNGKMDMVGYMAALEEAGFSNIGIEYLTDKKTKKDYQAIFAHVGDKSS